MSERNAAPVAQPLLSVNHVNVSYSTREGRVVAARDVSFDIRKGEVFGLVGESGSGKSTIAMAIMNYLGANGHAEGSILYNGRDILKLSPRELREIRGSSIAMVYQDPMNSLNPAIRVGDQIGEVLRIHSGLSREEAFSRAIEAMRQTQIADPEINAHRYPHQLSGGMQQRVVIAMALINAPDLLVLDEPTTGLDVTTEAAILDLIASLRTQYQTSILFITHDLGVIAQVSDRVGVMYAGEMVEVSTTERLFARPRHPYTLALMGAMPKPASSQIDSRLQPIPGRLPDLRQLPPGCIFAPRCRFAQPICNEVRPPLAAVNEQQAAACHFSSTLPAPDEMEVVDVAQSAATIGDELLTARDIKVYFSERTFWQSLFRQPESQVRAVDGLSLALRRGETIGIVGESGSGKTTFGRALVGLYPPSGGELAFNGADVTKQRTREAQKRIQFVFQNPDSSLNPRKRVGDIIGRPLKLYGTVNAERLPERVRDLLELVQLRPAYASRFPHELSGGEKQRVCIARAFAAEPDIVIADEPLSALDVSVQASILNLLIDLRNESGASYVFISHDLNTVRWLADRVVVMYLGSAFEVGTVDEVFEPPYHPYTEALLSAIPIANPAIKRERILLQGPVPSPRNPPTGCKFHTRCPRKIGAICEQQAPPGREVSPGHVIYCHHPLDELMNTVFAPTAPKKRDMTVEMTADRSDDQRREQEP